jgi:SAM-dependent methyltransferase
VAERLADPRHVLDQYRDPTRLEARVDLYARFASEPESWYRWLFDRIAPGSGAHVLDAGSGVGGVWQENRDRLPPGLGLVLVDRSGAMLERARDRLSHRALALAPVRADLRRLPFPEARFDTVSANHVLYHVPDRAAALRELARVVQPGGRLCVATNDWTHLQELRELAARLGVVGPFGAAGRDPAGFDLEAAGDEVGALWGRVRIERRRSVLAIDDPVPVAAYLRSLLPGGTDGEAGIAALSAHLARQIERAGVFETMACGGVAVAERP